MPNTTQTEAFQEGYRSARHNIRSVRVAEDIFKVRYLMDSYKEGYRAGVDDRKKGLVPSDYAGE